MLHIYYGNGKGKTTASVGLAVRSAGAGMKVVFMQFLKNGSSSEISVLKKLENIEVICCEECSKFTFQMSDSEKQTVFDAHDKMIRYALESNADLIVLDEFLDAYNSQLLTADLADTLIYSKNTELVLTGRNPSKKLIEYADYASEINAVKHPYSKGVRARKGIEY